MAYPRYGSQSDEPPYPTPEFASITAYSLIPINIDRSYGLTVFYLASNPDFALKNYDHVIFPSREEAEARLIQSHRSPAGTSRIHSYSLINTQAQIAIRDPYIAARRAYDISLLKANPFSPLPNPLSRHYRTITGEELLRELESTPNYFNAHYIRELSSCFFVTDTPIINSATLFSESTLSTYTDGLPCYTHSIASILSKKPLIDSEVSTGMFGLPLIKRIRFNLNGTPRRKPGLTIAAKKQAYLKARCTDIDPRPHFDVLNQIQSLISDIPRGFVTTHPNRSPSHLIACNFHRHQSFDEIFSPPPRSPNTHSSYWKDIDPFGAFYNRYLGSPPTHKNWDSEPHYHHSQFSSLIPSYERILLPPSITNERNPLSCRFGPLRCPTVYLYRRHSSRVLSILAPLLPDLLRFKSYPLTGYPNKTSPSLDRDRANTYNTYRRLIFLLARSMIQGPFQAAYRLRSFQFPTVPPPPALNVETPSEDTTPPASLEEAISESLS